MSHKFPDEMSEGELEALRAQAKEGLRKRMSALRRALPEAARQERARAMCAQVVAHRAFHEARVVAAYAPLRFEIHPGEVVRAAWAAGKEVALPRVDSATRTFTLHAYRPGDVLSEGGHLIEEPAEDAPLVDLARIDLALVPGLAFDAAGHRLGFGQGYYDRMLPQMTRAVRMGLAYDLSLLPEVPHDRHDVAMNVVVTCRRVLDIDA